MYGCFEIAVNTIILILIYKIEQAGAAPGSNPKLDLTLALTLTLTLTLNLTLT